jgi:hypothetical protein
MFGRVCTSGIDLSQCQMCTPIFFENFKHKIMSSIQNFIVSQGIERPEKKKRKSEGEPGK